MRTDWVERDVIKLILGLMFTENSLAMQVAIRHGMRIGDVLKIRTKDVLGSGKFTYTEQKTNKRRSITICASLRHELLCISGDVYVFEGRYSSSEHRTRQAVYKDIKRCCELLRLRQNVGTHTGRKIYAVERYRVTGNVNTVAKLMGHSDPVVTALYAFADELSRT